jgi:CRISPR-associated exonuclease Cas4
MSILILLLLILIFSIAVVLVYRSFRTSVRYSIPKGTQIYGDLISEGKVLRSNRYSLTGKPDKVVMSGRQVIPYEYKTTDADRPREGHMLQMGVYFIILEEMYPDKVIPYGVLRYREQAFRIDNTPRIKSAVLEIARQIRGNYGVPVRNHTNSGKCFRCSFKEGCVQSLIR